MTLDWTLAYVLAGAGVSAAFMTAIVWKLDGAPTLGARVMLLIVAIIILAIWPLALIAILVKILSQ